MKFKIYILIIALALLLIAITNPASALTCTFTNITQGLPGVQGIPGINGTNGTNGLNNMTMNMTMNQTPNWTPNMTANMTAGPAGAPNMTANMTMNQTPNMTSTFIGSQWYLHNVSSSDIANAQVFSRSFPFNLENTSSVMLSSPNTEMLIREFVTEPGDPQLTELPAGDRIWTIYGEVSTVAGGDTDIVVRLYKYNTSTTTATELYNLTIGHYSDTIQGLSTTKMTSTALQMNTTDRFLVRIYGKTTSSANPTITIYYDDNDHVSKTTSPITQGMQGPPGAANMTMNWTPNMTANMTMNWTPNLTANMTQGPQGIQGNTGNAATITVNLTQTGAPGSSASVVNIGTTYNAILDFIIPQGLMNQTPNMTAGADGLNNMTMNLTPNMTANMTAGANGLNNMTMNQTPNLTAGPPGGTGGQVLFFHHTAVEDPAGYEGLYQVPSGLTEADENVTVKTGLGEVLVDPYVTLAGYPDVTTIPAGLWRFRTYHYVDSNVGTTNAVFKVYNRSGTTETLLFTATSEDINALTATEYLTSYVQATNYTVALTDRIVVKVYGQSDHNSDIKFHFVYEGSTHTSHVLTPLEILSTLYIRHDGSIPFTFSQSMGGWNLTNLLDPVGDQDAATKHYVDSIVGQPNMTQNMTMNMTMNLTPNMTANMTSGPNNDAWYLWVNGTRLMAGNFNMSFYSIRSLVTGTGGDSATNKTYVDAVNTSMKAYVDAAPYVSNANTSLVLIQNTTYVRNPVTKYITLLAGSAMSPTTNPASLDQMETSTNKNNFIYGNFTDGGSENLQWIYDMPSDWVGTDATNGKITAYFLWTAKSGSGTVNFTLSGERFPDDAALDTALSSVGFATDTLITAGDMHVSPATTAAVIPTAGTAGQTVIFKVARDSTTDTLSGTAQLIGVRISYISTLA